MAIFVNIEFCDRKDWELRKKDHNRNLELRHLKIGRSIERGKFIIC